MDRNLDSLSSAAYPAMCQWIARCTARGVAVMIVQTGRTLAEHQTNLANGASGTTLSMHLPRHLRWPTNAEPCPLSDLDKCDAMDLVPFSQYYLHGPDKVEWDAKDPAFGILGEEAERVGLRWGGRWRTPFDPGHAELVLPWKAGYLAEERARSWPYPTTS